MTAYLDTNVLIRHLTGHPPKLARRSREILESEGPLILTDVIVAECVYVLESFYEVDRAEIVLLMRAATALGSIVTPNIAVVRRSLELYEDGHDFADSYLVACAEASGVAVASFDRAIDTIGTVERIG
ncbi:MAG: PIN domain-containing protein [Thermoleophilaceae bacterium]|nr:PIN domain-containing protein [Thermoleophilaceae bacterium]